MSYLLAVPAHNVPKSTSTAAATVASTCSTTPLFKDIGLWAVPGHMPRYIAQIANWLILTITSEVTSFPAVLAGLFVGAVCSHVTLFEAVVT